MRVFRRVAALMVGAVLMFVFLGACTPRPRRVVVVDAPAEVIVPGSRFLNAADRCDRRSCNARAYAAGWLLAGAEKYLPLYFCAHHWHEVDDPGTRFEYYVDETDRVLTDRTLRVCNIQVRMVRRCNVYLCRG